LLRYVLAPSLSFLSPAAAAATDAAHVSSASGSILHTIYPFLYKLVKVTFVF